MTNNSNTNFAPTIDPSDVIVVILGGGHGSRLFPLTKIRAKPAVSFGGKYRLIDIPITNCLNSQLNKIFILTQYNSFSLNRHIWQAYSSEIGRDGFIDVIAAEQTNESKDWFQGTADAVRRCFSHMLYHKPKYVLILSGDQVYSMDFDFLFSFHRGKNADITIASHYTASEDIHGLGIVKVDNNQRVIDFYEKPDNPSLVEDFKFISENSSNFNKPYLASMGLYLFSTDALVSALDNDKTDFGKTVIPLASKQMNMFSFPFNGYWEDVGTIKTFYDANMKWLDGDGIVSLFKGGNSIITHARQLPPAQINGTTIDSSIICEGSIIHAKKIKHSIIGVRGRIGKGCEIENSIIMGNTNIPLYTDSDVDNNLFDDDDEDIKITHKKEATATKNFEIGENCIIKNTIIDKDVHIGDGCKFINANGIENAETDLYIINSGIIVIAQNTVIPAGTII